VAKNVNDEYYTPNELAEYCVGRTKEILSLPLGTKFLEPSAGGGAFLPFLPEGTTAIDINPAHPLVSFGNFLEDYFEYKKGLCVIGNPPFGSRGTLAVKFFKRATFLGDYISFILPVSQLDNQQQMFEFDLVYSEDLGKRVYSGVMVHCCLNIYKRPHNGVNPKKPNYSVRGLKIMEYRRGGKQYPQEGFDWSCCSWGFSVGRTPEFVGQYVQEHYIYIDRHDKLKILQYLKAFDWKSVRPFTSTPKLQSWIIRKVIYDFIKGGDTL
jgi:hypothetical protein